NSCAASGNRMRFGLPSSKPCLPNMAPKVRSQREGGGPVDETPPKWSAHCRTLSWLIVFAVVLGTWGCGGVQQSKEALNLRAGRERLFEENLAGYQRQDPDEAAALAQLARYHDAQETFDLATLGELLAPEFELRYYTTDEKLQIQDRTTFLGKRRGW